MRALEPFHSQPAVDLPSGAFDPRALRMLVKTLRYYLLTRSRWRRRFFLRTLRDVMASGVSLRKLVEFIAYAIVYKHFHEFVSATYGSLEDVAPVSPFADAEPPAKAA